MNASLKVIFYHHLEQFVRVVFIFLPGEDVIEQSRTHDLRILGAQFPTDAELASTSQPLT